VPMSFWLRNCPTMRCSLLRPATRHSTRFRRCLSSTTHEYDILVVGGGVVGSAAANVLSQKHWKVALVDPAPALPTTTTDIPHPRSYALSPHSLKLLQLDANDEMVGKYTQMQVWEQGQPAHVRFGDAILLGACAEDAFLVRHLRQTCDCNVFASKVVDLALPARVPDGPAHVTLEDGTHIRTRLVVAADGAQSWIRQAAGIPVSTYHYGQHALTCTVQVHDSMPSTAFQRFCPSPLALLPTRSRQHAVIVWTTTPQQALYYKKNDDELVAQLNDLLQQGPEPLASLFGNANDPLSNLCYGIEKTVQALQYAPAMAPRKDKAFVHPPVIESLASSVLSFPLQRQLAATHSVPRLALLGDAAHTVHPMAGQGLNLGLQSVAALTDSLTHGTDPGTFGFVHHHGPAVYGIHVLHGLFHNTSIVGKHVKAAGMSLLQHVPILQKPLVQAASRGIGE